MDLLDPRIIELAKTGTAATLIFAMWLVTMAFFRMVLDQMEKRFTLILEQQEKRAGDLLEEQKTRDTQNFQLLRDLIETNQYVAGSLGELKTLIKDNQFCPIVKEGSQTPGGNHE
jgi:hypothetical protein